MLSSISLLGFIILQYYWATHNFEEKKINVQNVIKLCNQEIIEKIESQILEKSSNVILPTFKPISAYKNSPYDEESLMDSITGLVRNMEDQNFISKRKRIVDIINRHLSLGLNFDLDQLLEDDKIIEIISQVLQSHELKLDFFYSITDTNGIILFSNFKKKENELIENATIFSDEFLKDDIYNESKIFSLYVLDFEKSIIKSFTGVILISTLLIIIVIGTFIYSIRVINNQKKTTQIRTDFINNMTHELKTPIATIGLACEALKDKNISLNMKMENKFLNTIDREN